MRTSACICKPTVWIGGWPNASATNLQPTCTGHRCAVGWPNPSATSPQLSCTGCEVRRRPVERSRLRRACGRHGEERILVARTGMLGAGSGRDGRRRLAARRGLLRGREVGRRRPTECACLVPRARPACGEGGAAEAHAWGRPRRRTAEARGCATWGGRGSLGRILPRAINKGKG